MLYTCRGPETQLIVQFPDGLRAYVPVDWTDLASPQERDPPADPSHLLGLDGLRHVVRLIDRTCDHIRRSDRDITWEQFQRNQQRLDDNRTYRHEDHRGAVREGTALLQGIAL
jgi:hypothetical protein